jgi:uncharacterized protein
MRLALCRLAALVCGALAFVAAVAPAAVSDSSGTAGSIGPLLHINQSLNNCGPASVAEVLDYWGIEKSQTELNTILRHGNVIMSTDDVADYVASLGLREFIGNDGSDDVIKDLIANGLPVIVAQYVSPTNLFPHFRPIEAFDDSRQQFSASDPLLGAGYSLTYAEFDRLWNESQRTFLVIYPPSKQSDLEQALAAASFDGASWMTPFA